MVELSDAAKKNVRHDDWHEESIPLAHHTLYRKIDQHLKHRTPGRVLEVGCSRGRYLEELRKRGWDVVGIELQPQVQDYIVQHDLSRPLPYAEEFDVIIAAEIIEHLVDTHAFLKSMKDALKPGGTLILTTPNLLFVVNRLRMLAGRRPKFAYMDYHVRMFVWSDLSAKISKHFRIEKVQGSHVLLGVSRAPRLGRIAAALGDRRPNLAAHFIVTASKPQ